MYFEILKKALWDTKVGTAWVQNTPVATPMMTTQHQCSLLKDSKVGQDWGPTCILHAQSCVLNVCVPHPTPRRTAEYLVSEYASEYNMRS